jgi:hypothetical protein
MKLLEKIRDRMSGKTLKRDVRFDAEGFAVVPYEKPPVSVQWADVREVFALKHDLFATDEICLGFTIDESGGYVWVGEDDGGFGTFRMEVERRFAFDPTWFGRIVQPAFVEKRTTLWKRT